MQYGCSTKLVIATCFSKQISRVQHCFCAYPLSNKLKISGDALQQIKAKQLRNNSSKLGRFYAQILHRRVVISVSAPTAMSEMQTMPKHAQTRCIFTKGLHGKHKLKTWCACGCSTSFFLKEAPLTKVLSFRVHCRVFLLEKRT